MIARLQQALQKAPLLTLAFHLKFPNLIGGLPKSPLT